MKWLGSIKGRLALVLSLAIAGFWCVSVAISAGVFYSELTESFDSGLEQAAQGLLPLALDDVHELKELGRSLSNGEDFESEFLVYQFLDSRGRVLLRSHDAPARPLVTADVEEGFSTEGELRIYVARDRFNRFSLVVAEEMSHRQEAFSESVVALAMPLVGLLPVGAILIVLLARQALRPIDRLKEELAQRGRENLQPVGEAFPAELAPIAQGINVLMAGLKSALEAERAFAADSAHELRTPVAASLAQVQMLQRELPDDAAIKERVDVLEQALKRLARLTEKLLQLSRADAGLGLAGEASEIKPVIKLVIDERRSAHKGSEIRFVDAGADGMVSTLDPDGLSIVLGNLIDNAVVHGTPSKSVSVFLDEDRRLRIVNSGPVIAKERLAGLKQRFARISQQPGSGLGLAIADTILRQSGGELELKSPAADCEDGFEAIVHLPPLKTKREAG